MSGNPFFRRNLLRTQFVISRYRWVLLEGRLPLKSSQRRQRSAVVKGFTVSSLSAPLHSISLKSFRPRASMSLKYRRMKFLEPSSANPTISIKVSQYLLTLTPPSCLDVSTIWHLGSSLLSTRSENTCLGVEGASSNPSSTSNT